MVTREGSAPDIQTKRRYVSSWTLAELDRAQACAACLGGGFPAEPSGDLVDDASVGCAGLRGEAEEAEDGECERGYLPVTPKEGQRIESLPG